MGLSIAVDDARPACAESVTALVRAVDGLSEYELFGASRCHGWARLDVVTHVLAGWQEMLGGLVSPVDDEPTVDAATYWPAFRAAFGDEADDPVPVLMFQRRRGGAYARPSTAVEQLRDVADALLRGIASFGDRRCLWQGQVFEPGDFLTIWAVEDVVHHLDLLADLPPASAGLALARATVEALVGEPLPASWSDEDAVLIGTGRCPVPADAGHLAERLPALG